MGAHPPSRFCRNLLELGNPLGGNKNHRTSMRPHKRRKKNIRLSLTLPAFGSAFFLGLPFIHGPSWGGGSGEGTNFCWIPRIFLWPPEKIPSFYSRVNHSRKMVGHWEMVHFLANLQKTHLCFETSGTKTHHIVHSWRSMSLSRDPITFWEWKWSLNTLLRKWIYTPIIIWQGDWIPRV